MKFQVQCLFSSFIVLGGGGGGGVAGGRSPGGRGGGGGGRGGGGGGGRGRGNPRDTSLIGQTVRIAQGPFKGNKNPKIFCQLDCNFNGRNLWKKL